MATGSDKMIDEAERPSRVRSNRNMQDGIREEKLRSLKASSSAYRGAFTRIQNRIEQLMSEGGSYEEVQVEKASLDKTFISYSKCCQDIKDCLYDDEVTELCDIANKYTNVSKSKGNLDRKLEEWMIIAGDGQDGLNMDFRECFEPSELTASRVNEHERLSTTNEFAYPDMQGYDYRASKSGVAPGRAESQCNKSRDEKAEARSEASDIRRARVSVVSQSASIRRAKAELEKQQYMEMQEVERQQQAIDQQLELVQIKQEMELKRAELQHSRRLIKLESDIGMAKLEEEAEKSINYTTADIRDNLSTVSRRADSYIQDAYERELQSRETRVPDFHSRQNASSRQNATRSNEFTSERLPWRRAEGSYGAGESDPLYRVLQSQQESMILMANTLGSSIRKGFEMPKRDCLGFDGNPMNYPKFIENFKTNIEEREEDPRDRLAYLIQFCSGKAKEAISNCVMLPGEEGFSRAKEILHNSFGQSHIITHAYIDRVTKGGLIRDGDGEQLLQLARDMENYEINLTQLGCESEINAQSNLERIVTRLPRNMQAEWAKEAFVLLEKGKIPTFKNLTSFVTLKAKLASSAFGKLIGSRPQEDRYSKPKRTFQGSSFTAEGGLKMPTCYHCKKSGHLIERCFSFRKESLKAREDVVRKEKLCNLCLCKGHFEKQCRRKETCMVAECGQRNHSLLHPTLKPCKEEKKSLEVEDQVGINNKSEGEASTGHCGATGAGRPRVRLRVIPVKVRGVDEAHEVETYALLDDGSDVSLCDSSLVQRLGITGVPTAFSLTTVNEGKKETRGEEVRLIVSDLNGNENIDVTRAWTVNNLPVSKRSIPIANDVFGWSHLDGIVFPELENEKVSMIIGSDVPEAHWVIEQRRGGRKEPYAVRTPLGWTLMGPIGTETEREFQINFIRKEDNTLQEQVERMVRMDFSEADFRLEKGCLWRIKEP